MRAGSGVAPTKHKDYGTTFDEKGSVLSIVREILPGAFVSEQVHGFERKPQSGASPKELFMDKVLEIVGTDGNPHFVAGTCLRVNSDCWSEGSRPR